MATSKHTVSWSLLGEEVTPTGEWNGEDTRHDPDTPVEQRFLLRLRDKPDDLEMRMVFADWLEERGEAMKSEYLRLVSQKGPELAFHASVDARLRRLALHLEPGWRAIVSRAAIEKCDLKFELKCPKRWESLASTDNDRVRHCGTCARDVHFCASREEVGMHGRQGNCVAFCASLTRTQALDEYDGDEMLMGEIEAPPDIGDLDEIETAVLGLGKHDK